MLKADPEHLLDLGSPGTSEHMRFWEAKAANLNCIHEQLEGPKVRGIVKVRLSGVGVGAGAGV